MSARKSLINAGGVTLAAALCAGPAAFAGHEVPYYPSFYPQEIRIEPLEPQAAAREFLNTRDPLHAYIGAPPQFSGEPPASLKSVVSLASFITARVPPRSTDAATREPRCRALASAASALAAEPDVVAQPYPITPYHADYIHHVDRIAELKPDPAQRSAALDVSVEDVEVDKLLRDARAGSSAWPTTPWSKNGWFQAYHLLRPTLSDPNDREEADALFELLTGGVAPDVIAHVAIERDLVTALTRNCERAVIGYRLRREFHSDDFSNGVENVSVDSQYGLNAPVVVRTLKLKDLPWNGWLRVGISERASAAWNPVAGFTDAAGRLVWATVGDDAFVPIPYNSRFAPGRVEIRPAELPATRQSIRIPSDAITTEPGAGRLVPADAGRSAMTKITYRVLASPFQDGSEMETADLLYPYALAYRWGSAQTDGGTFDPDIASRTKLLREQFKAVRIVRTEVTKLPIADLVFTYRSPIVEVYVDAVSSDEAGNALLAPPWSCVPWHLLALMEAAVERHIAAFSRTEAERRGLPWLDLVRDPAQLAAMRELVKEFARTGYRPAALADLVSPQAATARWNALDQFVEANGHLLVTNGPYRLRSFTPDVYTFDVIREFTYPVGIGMFDFYAYPPKALITRVEHIGNRVLLTADVEFAVKQQRDRKTVRMPLTRDTMRGVLPIHAASRYIVVTADGKLAAVGAATRERDGRFAATLPALAPGDYTFFGAILLDDNTISPSIGRIDFRQD